MIYLTNDNYDFLFEFNNATYMVSSVTVIFVSVDKQIICWNKGEIWHLQKKS